jgi:cytochrome c oxidase cbb3-type subunit 4
VSTVELEQIRIYLYIIGTGLAVVIFYYYIIYLYRTEKKGKRDYEKYGNLALDDELDSRPLEENINEKKE